MTVKFSIPGPAVGKARPRVCRTRNGSIRAFTPDKTVRYENLVKMAYVQAAGKYREIPGPLQIEVRIYATPEKSAGKKRGEQMAFDGWPITKKPDLDNVLKCICDALNGIAYRDDAQIARAWVEKRYGSENRVDVEIGEFEI